MSKKIESIVRDKFLILIFLICLLSSLLVIAKKHYTLEDLYRMKNFSVCADRVCVEKDGLLKCWAFDDVYLFDVFTQRSVLPNGPAIIYIKLKKSCNRLYSYRSLRNGDPSSYKETSR